MNSKQRRKRRRERVGYGRFFRADPKWHKTPPWQKREIIAELFRIKAEMEAEIFKRLKFGMAAKIPFTDEGVKQVEDAVRKVLTDAAERGDIAAQGYEVNILPPTDEDREQRVVRGTVRFSEAIRPVKMETFEI